MFARTVNFAAMTFSTMVFAVPTSPPPAASHPAATMPASGAPAPELQGVDRIKSNAQALLPTVKTDLARQFLLAAQTVPAVVHRTIYQDPQTKAWLTQAQAATRPQSDRDQLREVLVDDDLFYNSKYGTPLAYVRAMERLGEAGVSSLKGARVMDFGCGGLGPLRLMALCGADVTGVDVDPFLGIAYSQPDDTGQLLNADNLAVGRTELVLGSFPADAVVAERVGSGYDLIISKNTLKRGYVHPEREADPRLLIDLGVSDMAFLSQLFDRLNPGGFLVIYNLSPRLSAPDEKFIPWSDGRCAFDRAALEKAGFQVLVYDSTDDDHAVRAMGRLLGWDAGEGGMDLEHDLFSHFTIARRN